MFTDWNNISGIRIKYFPNTLDLVYVWFMDSLGDNWVLTEHPTLGIGFSKSSLKDLKIHQGFTSPFIAEVNLKDFARTKSFYLYEHSDINGNFYNLSKQPSSGKCLLKPRDNMLMTKKDFDEALNVF